MPPQSPDPAADVPRLILASSSARRRELLRSAWISFEVDVSDEPETPLNGEPPEVFARRMAQAKARAVATRRRAAGDRRVVLGADTVVVLDDETIGKPRDRDDARRMLRQLSGRTHRVLTAFCLIDGDGGETIETINTEVLFESLTDEALERYLDGARWHDKAGAYAVQEHAAWMVRAVHGSYTNVVGLPLAETIRALAALGVTPHAPQPERIR